MLFRSTGANGQYGGLHLRRYGFGPGSRLRPVLPNGFGYYVLYSIKNSLPSCYRLMRKRISGPGGMCFSTVVFNFVHNSTVEGARGAFSVYVY